MVNMDMIYGLLAAIAVGFVAVLWLIGPVLAEVWGLMMLPIGDAMQWVACRLQEVARRLWMAGRWLEQQGKIYRRVS
jgi:uncharacterized membrane protein YccC